MKKEVSFFKDRRGGFSAENLIALYRSLGYSDEQIKAEMLKLKSWACEHKWRDVTNGEYFVIAQVCDKCGTRRDF